MRQRVIAFVLIIAAVVGATVLAVTKPFDTRMGAHAAARELQRKLRTPYSFHCRRQENDESMPLEAVDYECEPVARPTADGYWVDTDSHHIIDMLPMP